MTRLLFISHIFPNRLQRNFGSFNRDQAKCLTADYDVDVIAPIPWTKSLRSAGIPCEDRLEGMRVVHPVYYYVPWVFRQWQGHSYLASIESTVAGLFRERRYDVIFSSWLYPDSWAAARISERYDVPLYAKVLGTDVNRLKRGEAASERARDAMQTARKIICVSRSLQDALIGFGADPDKLSVIYNGVHREIFFPMDKGELRRSFGIPGRDNIVLYVGNLIREKGLRELVIAFSEIRKRLIPLKTRLYFIGTGPFLAELKKMISAYGVAGDCTFLGGLPHFEVAKWMNVADVACLPSYSEGLPNVVNEALACGTNVVATSVGGIPELFVEGGRLFLVPPRDATALATELELALGHLPERGTDHPLFSWKENAESTRCLMSKVAEQFQEQG